MYWRKYLPRRRLYNTGIHNVIQKWALDLGTRNHYKGFHGAGHADVKEPSFFLKNVIYGSVEYTTKSPVWMKQRKASTHCINHDDD